MVVTRGKRGGGTAKGKGGQIRDDRRELDLGGEHTMQSTDDVS